MKRIKLKVAYDGTAYSGWQIQPNAITIEEVLDKAIFDLTGETIHVTGASRTDAGVHAMGNVAVFDTNSTIPGERFAYALGRFLPEDVVIQESREVKPDFHPRHCNTVKTYEYKILNTTFAIPQQRNYTWHVSAELDIRSMQEAARILVGEHDFKSFCCVRTQAESTVRTIYSVEVEAEAIKKAIEKRTSDAIRENGSESTSDNSQEESVGSDKKQAAQMIPIGGGEKRAAQMIPIGSGEKQAAQIVTIRIRGNGFLYNMVRIIAGTLMQVGRGQLDAEKVRWMLESKDRCMAGQTAPPQGLTLMDIDYVDGDDSVYSSVL